MSDQRSQTRRGARWTGAAVAALAAVLLLAGTGSARWWSGEKGSAEWGVGLREFELCGGGDVCRSARLEGMGGGSEAWPRLGTVASWAGGGAGLFLALAAAAILLFGPGRLALRLGQIAAALSMIALVVGAGFAWTYPGFSGLGVGWALVAYLGGAALGVGSAGVLIAGVAARPAA